MDIVCASPIAHQCGSVRSLRRSFASGCGSIRLLRGEIAGYSLGERGNGGTVAFENELVRSSSRKTFMRGMGMNIVCASPIAHQCGSVRYLRRSFASGCGSIRLLRGAIAGYSLRNEVVAAFCFGFSFWLHQWGIPYRFCRFYLLLAGAVGKRQGISIPYPSPTPLLTPLGIRCGGAY